MGTRLFCSRVVTNCFCRQYQGENPFVVTEISTKTEEGWKLATETYTRIVSD